MSHIETFPCQGVYAELDDQATIREQLMRVGVSIYGYTKRVAALVGLRDGENNVSFAQAQAELAHLLQRVHEPMTWEKDVATKRIKAVFKGN